MKIVFLHGLGQTAQDWQAVIKQTSFSDVDCPELFSLDKNDFTYSNILSELENRYLKKQHDKVITFHDYTLSSMQDMKLIDLQ